MNEAGQHTTVNTLVWKHHAQVLCHICFVCFWFYRLACLPCQYMSDSKCGDCWFVDFAAANQSFLYWLLSMKCRKKFSPKVTKTFHLYWEEALKTDQLLMASWLFKLKYCQLHMLVVNKQREVLNCHILIWFFSPLVNQFEGPWPG